MLQRRSVLFWFVAFVLAVSLVRGADQTITIGLFPDGLTQEERTPLRDYLTKTLGRPVKLVVAERYTETEARLADGSYNFAFLGGLTYIRSHAKEGVVPLVQRTSDQQFHSVFITGANSGIHSLQDLKGKRFAFGDVNSTSGHLIPYKEMLEVGLNPDTDLKTQYSGAHPVTAALVESGAVDAGALDESVLSTLIDTKKIDGDKVRIFHTSKPFVDYVFVARKGVAEADREKFARAFLELKEGEDDAVLRVLRAKKFVAANDQEYDALRRIAKARNLY